MRTLWPVNNTTITSPENEDIQNLQSAIASLQQDITNLTDALNNDIANLQQYKIDNEASITTENLNATNAILNNITSAIANLTAITSTEVTATTLQAAIATVENLYSDEANLEKIISGEIATDSLIANEALINALTVTDLIVQGSQAFQNLFITNLEAGNLDVTNNTVQNETVQSLTAETANITTETVANSTITNVKVNNLNAVNSVLENIDVGALTHTSDYITISNDADSVIIAPPHFKNGNYQMIAIDEANTPLWAVNVFNDINNIWFSWSRKTNPIPYIEFVRLFNIKEQEPRAYFKLNILGHTLRVFFTSNSYNTVLNNPQTFETFPFATNDEGCLTYTMVADAGVYFSNNVDIISSGEHDYATLQLTSSDSYSTSGETTVYDGKTASIHTEYKPDQSVNSNDDVKFLSVEAPFLGIADAKVNTRFQSPNIYNGPTVDTTTLDDETLYIPIGSTNGTTVPGIEVLRLSGFDDVTVVTEPTGREVDKFYASTLQKAITNQSFLMDEYQPKNGYILDDAVYNEWLYSIADSNYNRNYLLVNELTNDYYIVSAKPDTQNSFSAIKTTDVVITAGTIDLSSKITLTGDVGVYTDATLDSEITDIFGPQSTAPLTVLPEGQRFYLYTSENAYIPSGYYKVVRNAVGFRTTEGIAYTYNTGGAKLYRKTTKDSTVQVLPLIPYREVEA